MTSPNPNHCPLCYPHMSGLPCDKHTPQAQAREWSGEIQLCRLFRGGGEVIHRFVEYDTFEQMRKERDAWKTMNEFRDKQERCNDWQGLYHEAAKERDELRETNHNLADSPLMFALSRDEWKKRAMKAEKELQEYYDTKPQGKPFESVDDVRTERDRLRVALERIESGEGENQEIPVDLYACKCAKIAHEAIKDNK